MKIQGELVTHQPREHSCLGPPHHSAHLIGHGFQPFDQPAYTPSAACWQSFDFLPHPAGTVENLPDQAQQSPILSLTLQFPFLPFAT